MRLTPKLGVMAQGERSNGISTIPIGRLDWILTISLGRLDWILTIPLGLSWFSAYRRNGWFDFWQLIVISF